MQSRVCGIIASDGMTVVQLVPQSDPWRAFKAAYPKRVNPAWTDARKALERRLKEGYALDFILAATKGYSDWCAHEGHPVYQTGPNVPQ